MEPIAIIGMACIFPGAANAQRYWHNILNGVDAISDVPSHRWPAVFYDPQSTSVDRFYCRRGGFVDDYVDFDPLRFGVMPKAAQASDPDQLLSLRIGAEALRDAGYDRRDFARDKAGVIIGRGNYLGVGTARLDQHLRMVQQTLQILRDLMPDISETQLARVRAQIKDQLDYCGPDVAVGLIPNLVASRLANRLDLHGPAYTVDAACASSLIAIENACQSLWHGQSDLMLAGGSHFTHDPVFWATFCLLGALSRSQQIRPFSQQADGLLAGEGIGMLVLKRWHDAQADGDRAYALIHGAASASDGRSSSLLAPSVVGQLLALQRAWEQTGLQPDQLGLLEAHGTGTPVGDQAELETVRQFFAGGQRDGNRPVIGSVKSMIGHTMPAAGVAGVIKAALAVHHGVLPPTLHCEQPHELLQQTRFRTLQRYESWPERDTERVAAVNAFGFGGINAHVVMGAAPARSPRLSVQSAGVPLPRVATICADSREELLERLLSQRWQATPGTGRWRLAIIEPEQDRLDLAAKIVRAGSAWHGRKQIYFSSDALIAGGGKVAFLFPGVDSSFAPRADDVAAYFGRKLPRFYEKRNLATELSMVVRGITEFNLWLFEILGNLRIRPDAMAGHSIGEWCAMAASGMFPPGLVEELQEQLHPDSLHMLDVVFVAAACSEAVARGIAEAFEGVAISHENCPHQVIFCGRETAAQRTLKALQDRQIVAQRLPFASGFHSPFFAERMEPYREFYTATPLREPSPPLWSATTGQPFPATCSEKQQLAMQHLLQPVRFQTLINNMYRSGYRAFIQVGTGSLVGFVDDILRGQPHLAVSANSSKCSGMQQLCELSAALWVEGAQFDTALLNAANSDDAEPREKNGPSIRLRLGVPLIRLSEPLPVLTQAEYPAVGAMQKLSGLRGTLGDPVQAAFQDTLARIHQASAAVVHQQRRPKSHASGAASHALRIVPSSDPPPFVTRIRRHLDVASTIPLVADHAFYQEQPGWPILADRRPVIPLTMEVALLRAALEQHLPQYVVIRFEDIQAYKWLEVAKPIDIDIELEMKAYPQVEVSIAGYMRAQATIDRHYPSPPTPRDTPLLTPRAAIADARTLYDTNWMFHGPAYQGITQLGPIAANGIVGRIRVPAGEGALLDNMGQLAGYWVMEQDSNCLAMPIAVERINFYRTEPEIGAVLDCQVCIRRLDNDSCISDQQLRDSEGRVVLTMEGWRTRRYELDRDFFLHIKDVQTLLVSTPLPDGVTLFRDSYETAIVREHLALRFLNQPELAVYKNTAPRRKRQWLSGRVAAKDAVRSYLWKKHGPFALFPKELMIVNLDSGQPQVGPHIRLPYNENMYISIGHKGKLAVAVAAEHPVGVDIESVVPRGEQFIDLTFSERERGLLPQQDRDEWATRFWVAKEVLAKVRGTGLQGNPRQFPIERVRGERILVDDEWVKTMRHADHIIGWKV
jgi:acyl transferase domain-containing protein/phosphopantetheinyl transferase